MGILLDTNILVDWLRWHRSSRPKNNEQKFLIESARVLVEKLIYDDIDIFLSCHTIKELLQYPNISIEEERRIKQLLPSFCSVLPTTYEIAEVAGLMSRHSHEYRNHHIEDCYIAATAIVRQIPLYTRNPADYSYVQHEHLIIKVPYVF